MYLVILLAVSLFGDYALLQAAVTADAPVNTVVVVGSDVTFCCHSQSGSNTTSFRWYYYPPRSNQPEVIHTGLRPRAQFAERHDVITDHTNGRSQLTITGVRLQDAGCYSCYELSASRTATKLAADLVVLGSDPVCGVNVSSHDNTVTQHDRLQLMCSVNYSGNWAPSVHCQPTTNISTVTVTQWAVTYTEHLLVTANHNTITMSCTTNFVQSNRRQVDIAHLTIASNTPAYVRTWMSSPINVLYAVRSVRTTVIIEEGCVVRLECWSDGNPAAQYSWIEWTDHRRTTGRVYRPGGHSNLTLGDSMLLVVQCFASNVIAKRSYVAASSNVTLRLTAAEQCLETRTAITDDTKHNEEPRSATSAKTSSTAVNVHLVSTAIVLSTLLASCSVITVILLVDRKCRSTPQTVTRVAERESYYQVLNLETRLDDQTMTIPHSATQTHCSLDEQSH